MNKHSYKLHDRDTNGFCVKCGYHLKKYNKRECISDSIFKLKLTHKWKNGQCIKCALFMSDVLNYYYLIGEDEYSFCLSYNKQNDFQYTVPCTITNNEYIIRDIIE